MSNWSLFFALRSPISESKVSFLTGLYFVNECCMKILEIHIVGIVIILGLARSGICPKGNSIVMFNRSTGDVEEFK